MNGYIPDCTNIGTTFTCSIANMLTCAALDVKLHLGPHIIQLMDKIICGDFKILYGFSNLRREQIEIGSLRYGQPIDILVQLNPRKASKVNISAIKDIKVTYESQGQKYISSQTEPISKCTKDEIEPTLMRYQTFYLLKKIESSYKSHWDSLSQELVKFIAHWSSKTNSNPIMEGILENLKV